MTATIQSPNPVFPTYVFDEVLQSLTSSSQSQQRNGSAVRPSSKAMQDRYDAIVKEMKETHQVRVNKWRKSMTGCAWVVYYYDGSVSRLIESPRPKGPMSAAIFLHEIGHHAIGFNKYSPRCFEEYKAWEWSMRSMVEYKITITDRVRKRVHDSLRYAVAKALRRGLKQVPEVLMPYVSERMLALQAV